MGNGCHCLDKADKYYESDMTKLISKESPQLAEFTKNGKEMIEEIKEIYMEFLKNGPDSIKEIRIIAKTIDENSLSSLLIIVPELSDLTGLVFKKNSIASDSIIKLLEKVYQGTLRKLWLLENDLSDSDLESLAPFLKRFPNLEYLHLDNNNLTRNCSETITSILESLPKLKGVSLKYNQIVKKGFRRIFRAIKTSQNLEYFYIQSEYLSFDEILRFKNKNKNIRIEDED